MRVQLQRQRLERHDARFQVLRKELEEEPYWRMKNLNCCYEQESATFLSPSSRSRWGGMGRWGMRLEACGGVQMAVYCPNSILTPLLLL
jgi:hypothetical protein